MLDPAQRIADKFGGYTQMAESIGRHRTTIWRWAQSKEDIKNGGDGFIPSNDFKVILNAAKKQGIELELWELTNVYD